MFDSNPEAAFFVQECTIKDIGKSNPGMGEGVYVGSSRDEPYDYSNNNRVSWCSCKIGAVQFSA